MKLMMKPMMNANFFLTPVLIPKKKKRSHRCCAKMRLLINEDKTKYMAIKTNS